jgi:iron complex transport system ATP-binding protein
VMMGRSPALQTFQRESKEDMEIVEKAMRMTDVLRLADREIDQVSGGERQRVIIARALAQRPKVLLLDEPTLHLDVNHQLEVLDLVQDLAKSEGLTVIMVSHDLDLAARYCDRVIMLSEGSIRAAGKVEKVLTSENLEAVFKIRAYVKYDEEIGAHRVNIISVSNNGKEH